MRVAAAGRGGGNRRHISDQLMSLHPDFLTKPLAHRGLHNLDHGAPENSLKAIASAVAKGYGVELDLQLSKDGQAMVFHDYVLDRLTGETGLVAQRTSAELGEVRIQGTSQFVSTLAKALKVVDGRAPLLIEFKDQDGALGPNTLALEEATARALKGYDGPVAVMSFNPHMIANMARLAPDVCRGLVSSDFTKQDWDWVSDERRAELRGFPDFNRVGAAFISHNAKHLPNHRVAQFRQSGVPVLCWTVRSVSEEKVVRRLVDNITFEGYDPDVSPR